MTFYYNNITFIKIKINFISFRLSWDTPVRDFLGDQFYFGDAMRSKYATLRDILSHRMGLPSNNAVRLQAGIDLEMLAT